MIERACHNAPARASVILEFGAASENLRHRIERFERREGMRLRKIGGGGGPKVTAYVCDGAKPPVYSTRRRDGSFAIVDGEIYDIDQARGAKFDGDPSAWALDAYRRSGTDVFSRLDMSASLALWDARAEVLHVVRDRFGIVPSFYHRDGGALIWASDIWAAMRLSGRTGFDRVAIDFFLANGFVLAPGSLIEGIAKIPPAHALSFTAKGGTGLRRYWPRAGARPPAPSIADWTEAMTECFRAALRRRWETTGPSAAFLSGGMDSALVVSGLRKLLETDVDTFTIGYEDYQGKRDERERARAVARTLGVRHHELSFGPQDVADNHETMVRAHGSPFVYGVRAFFLRPIADAGFQAILGGDPPESCYPKRLDVAALALSRIPRPVRTAATPAVLAALSAWRPDFARKVRALRWSAEHDLLARCGGSLIPEDIRATLYSDRALIRQARQQNLEIMQADKADYADWSAIDRRVYLQLRYFVAEHTLAFNHWWTTWHGLKYRAPFCGNRIVDVAMSLPRTTWDKVHLRHFAKTLLPDDIVERPNNKAGVPIKAWLRGPLRDLAGDVLSAREIGRLDFLQPDGVRALLADHMKGRGNHGIRIWSLLTMVAWARLVEDVSREIETLQSRPVT